jgi:hypothetical protein
MERASQWVTVTTRRGRVRLPWEARQALLERLRQFESAAPIVQAFEAVGTSAPVRLTPVTSAHLYGLLDRWADEVTAEGLPPGVLELRDALAGDLHGAAG